MKYRMLTASLGLVGLGLISSPAAFANSKQEIDAGVATALQKFYQQSATHEELANKAVAMLVFPHVIKAGAGVAGEYGEGVLLKGNKTLGYYKLGGASVGLTAGAAERSEIIMFMTQPSLADFKRSHHWTIGADTGIAVVSRGAGARYDTETLKKPILGFVFDEKGLIGDVSLSGEKISAISK